MLNRAERPRFEKSQREHVSSPTKRQILDAQVIQTSEGPAIRFLMAESSEPSGIIDGQINMEASDKYSGLCPKCKTKLLVRGSHRAEGGDVAHWTVECFNCGLTGKVWND